MKKALFFLLAVIFTVSFSLFASADDGVTYTLSDDGTYYILTSYKKNEAEARISASYNGLPVRKIAANAFCGNYSTYKIVIPDSVEEIEGGAFSAMASLSEFEASGAFTAADGVLFTSDKKTLVRYPQALTGEYKIPSGANVYDHAFSGSSLSSVDASGAAVLGDYSFYLSDVKSVTFSASLDTVGAHAFEKSAVEKIVISSAAKIKEYAFSTCEKLVYADVSSAVLDGEGIFFSDTSLLAVSYPARQKNVPALTFCGCTSLMTAPVGKDVTEIGEKAFYGCTGLKYAATGGAATAEDAFGLCDKVSVTDGAFSSVSVTDTAAALKVNEEFTVLDGNNSDLITRSHIIRINGGKITALSEGVAEVYAVSRAGGDCRVVTVTVSDGAGVIESDHPYGAGRVSYVYTVPGSPDRISVTFSSSDSLSLSDSLSVYDKNNNCYGIFTGSKSAGRTVFIDGDTVRAELISAQGGGYGFRIVSAVPVSSLDAVTGISLIESVTMNVSEKRDIDAQVIPARAFPDELVYVSGNKDVVAVSSDGILTATGAGETKVTVYSVYYGVFAECTIKVNGRITEEPDFEYEIRDGGAYITRYGGFDKNCVIPPSIDGFTVIGIADGALSYGKIKSVHIPETVRDIAQTAFNGCSALTRITVDPGNKVYSARDGALLSSDGTLLIKAAPGISGEYTIPETVKEAADGAFSYCFKIDTVNVGGGVVSLSGASFAGASSLKRINADNGAYTSVDGVLYTADKKTLVFFPAAMNIHTYTVIPGTENIGAYAFYGVMNLSGIVLSESVRNIDELALCDAYSVAGISVNSSNIVYTADGGSLLEFGALKFVPKTVTGVYTVPKNTYKILPYAFYNCYAVEDVVFASDVTEIGDFAFGNCRCLCNLYLPQTVRKIGYDAFYNDALLTVYIPGSAEITYLSSCRVLCENGSPAHVYCENNGVEYDFTYYSEHGLYSVYSPVRGAVRVVEDKDPVYISKVRAVSGQGIKTYALYMRSDELGLPAGEYALKRQSTSSKRYFFRDNVLTETEQNALGIYRRYIEHIIEFTGETAKAAIFVKTPPDKAEYQKYEELECAGLSLYYTGEDGLTTVIYDGFEMEADTSTAGKKKALIKFKDLSTETEITVITAYLTGTVEITGDPRYNITLTADVSKLLPAGVPLSYRWYRDGEIIPGEDKQTYTPAREDIGKTLTVTVHSSSDIEGEITSAGVKINKAKAQIPPKPEIDASSMNSVTLKPFDGCEYRLSFEGEFTDKTEFTGLTPNTTYVFCQRYRETDTTEPSPVSSISFKTPEPLKIRSDVYFLNTANRTVSLVEPKTTAKDFISNFKDGEYLSVYKNGEKMDASDMIGTGCEIRLYVDGVMYDSYTVAITGDVNGDGKITITDYLQIKERILNSKTLLKEKEYAADVNGDGKVTITDYLRLKFCIQNGQSPEQNRY